MLFCSSSVKLWGAILTYHLMCPFTSLQASHLVMVQRAEFKIDLTLDHTNPVRI